MIETGKVVACHGLSVCLGKYAFFQIKQNYSITLITGSLLLLVLIVTLPLHDISIYFGKGGEA